MDGVIAVEPYTQTTDAINLEARGIDAGLRRLGHDQQDTLTIVDGDGRADGRTRGDPRRGLGETPPHPGALPPAIAPPSMMGHRDRRVEPTGRRMPCRPRRSRRASPRRACSLEGTRSWSRSGRPSPRTSTHLRIDVLRRAVEVYLGIAYPSGPLPEAVRRRLEWPADVDAATLLTRPPFERVGKAGPRRRRRSSRSGWATRATRT